MVRVLVVEDDPTLREMVAQILDGEGYVVARAAHGVEAVQHLSTGPRPDIVLLDMLMPLMDGVAVWQWMQTAFTPEERPCIVVLSASYPAPSLAGVTAFLAKPFDIDEMLEAVQRSRPPLAHRYANTEHLSSDHPVLPAA